MNEGIKAESWGNAKKKNSYLPILNIHLSPHSKASCPFEKLNIHWNKIYFTNIQDE